MTEPRKYTVLGRAESYREEIPNRRYRPSEPKRTFEQVRDVLLPQVKSVVSAARKIPSAQKLDEVVVEVRLGKDFLAKSYHPEALLKETGLKLRGSGVWEALPSPEDPKRKKKAPAKTPPVAGPVRAKSLFVSGDATALDSIQALLEHGAGKPKALEGVTSIDEVRLATADERLGRGVLDQDRDLIATEVVLFAWDSQHREQALRRLKELLGAHGVKPEDLLIRPYVDGPTFVAGKFPKAALRSMSHLNFLRIARLLPRVELTRTALGMPTPAPAPPRLVAPTKHWIAVFDGGVSLPHPHLDGLVIAKDCTPKAPAAEYLAHGTAVCSATLYGSISPNQRLEQPVCGVLSFRVLPDAKDDDLALYGVVDAIETEVPRLPPNARVINVSLGPAGPFDPVPGRFTYAIDRLSYETGRLFFTAVGNWGIKKAGLERIQMPADSVNNLAIGAYRLEPTTGEQVHAEYSCRGPGRSGCAMKPDLVGFGGSPEAPFYVVDGTSGMIVGTQGTSFSTPTASSLAGSLLAQAASPLTTQACRALLIAAAEPLEQHDGELCGWGALPPSLDSILVCTKTKVSIAYAGVISPRRSWRLPFLLPSTFVPNGKTTFEWTVVYAPDVDPTAIDDYTLAGIEPAFRPHKHRYRFTHADHPRTPKTLDVVLDAAVVKQYETDGWVRSVQPVGDQNVHRSESALRGRDAKWETVVRGQRAKLQDGLLEPALTLGIVGRGAWDSNSLQLRASYAAVLTVHAPKYRGDLYADVLNAYPLLQPIQLRSRTEVLSAVEI